MRMLIMLVLLAVLLLPRLRRNAPIGSLPPLRNPNLRIRGYFGGCSVRSNVEPSDYSVGATVLVTSSHKNALALTKAMGAAGVGIKEVEMLQGAGNRAELHLHVMATDELKRFFASLRK